MRHYQREELQRYKEGLSEGKLNENIAQEIEAHLAGCVQCQEKFLALVSTAEVGRAAELLSPDFTDKVLAGVAPFVQQRQDGQRRSRQYGRQQGSSQQRKSGQSRPQKSSSFLHKQSRERRQSLVLYYVGAAVITLVFVSNGLFQKIIDVTPQMALLSSMERMERFEVGEKERGFDFPRKAVDQAAQWIENFEMPKGREGEVR